MNVKHTYILQLLAKAGERNFKQCYYKSHKQIIFEEEISFTSTNIHFTFLLYLAQFFA